MKTNYIKVGFDDESDAHILEAGQILRRGGLVAFPTETVYGLGGDALNPASSMKIYTAKGRPSDNPLIVHICRWEDIFRITTEVTEAVKRLAEAFWPGPLTMILKKSDLVPTETTGGLDTVAVRFPSNETARRLIDAAGGYVAAPSANTSGRPSPTMAEHVREDMNGKIEMILDGGTVGIGLESTVVDMTGDSPVILRPGYVTQQMLSEVVAGVTTDRAILEGTGVEKPRAPGMKYRHYAPCGELTVVEGNREETVEYINRMCRQASGQGRKTGVIAADETAGRYHADCVMNAGSRADEEAVAHNLFRILRAFDEQKTEVIYSEAFSAEGIGQAIMNRLLKAAGYHVIKL